jgi:hypothetical protein
MLSAEEKEIVLRVAKGQWVEKHAVEKIYRDHAESFRTGRQVVEMEFLYECLAVCPDLALRAKYRHQIISGEKNGNE